MTCLPIIIKIHCKLVRTGTFVS